MAGLTRQQMIQTWQGLQSVLTGLPSNIVPTAQVDGLSDGALAERIRLQQAAIDNNAAVRRGNRPAFDPNGNVQVLGANPNLPPGARTNTIDTLRRAIANPAEADMGQFHAILSAYSDGQNFTIPDLAFDTTVTEAEQQAALKIANRLEAGENAPAIRAAFTEEAATLQEQQRLAAEAEAERQRIAAEQEAERRRAAEAAARQQQNLQTAVDSHFAALGMINPDQIGNLTAQQRANYLTRFMQDNAMLLQKEGTESARLGNLTAQQAAAVDMNNGYGVNANALIILQSGRQGMHMAEEVRQWLDSGDPQQIRMAQATIGTTVTGQMDAITHSMGTNFIRAPYATNLEDVPGIVNPTGGLNPMLTYRAANAGHLYIPTDDELRAAGVTEDQIAAMAGSKPASEILAARTALETRDPATFTAEEAAIWVTDTREELVANMYLADQTLYTRVIEARNAAVATASLETAPPVNVEAPIVEIGTIEVIGDGGNDPLAERAAANNPLELRRADPTVLGGSSSVAGGAYQSVAAGATPDGTLVFDGPDKSLAMVADHIRPADGHLTMEEALRRVHYLQTTDQQLFLGGAMGSSDMPTGSYAGMLARELGYAPNHRFDFSDPKQLNDLLTGVVSHTNRMSIPQGDGSFVTRFIASDDPSIVSMRESISRVANGNPILTRPTQEPATVPEGAPTEEVTGEPLVSQRSITTDPTVTGSIESDTLWRGTGTPPAEGVTDTVAAAVEPIRFQAAATAPTTIQSLGERIDSAFAGLEQATPTEGQQALADALRARGLNVSPGAAPQ